jgi:hypothetical protein
MVSAWLVAVGWRCLGVLGIEGLRAGRLAVDYRVPQRPASRPNFRRQATQFLSGEAGGSRACTYIGFCGLQ